MKSKKICIKCFKLLDFDDFVWMPSMGDKRNKICKGCEAVEIYKDGVTTRRMVENMHINTGISREYLFEYPDLIESYKLNLLIKKLL